MNSRYRAILRIVVTAGAFAAAAGAPGAVSAQNISPGVPGRSQLPSGASQPHGESPNAVHEKGGAVQPDNRAAGHAGAHRGSPDSRGASPRGSDSRNGGAGSGGARSGAVGGTPGGAGGGGAGNGDAHGY
ncbi:hypothetical protein F3J16_11705 [Burkholderia sp. Ap-962]|uniref:hypothetical protein n=1 Tax=Burkholderia sp. Ap-962 TaxID=2608333 RepID=UPI0014238C1B|nr:hypothetical protein [Burkholderia sp. Ap-962]NIF70843.1 hypothetical protein [Burkholderia sp. Ap-962]